MCGTIDMKEKGPSQLLDVARQTSTWSPANRDSGSGGARQDYVVLIITFSMEALVISDCLLSALSVFSGTCSKPVRTGNPGKGSNTKEAHRALRTLDRPQQSSGVGLLCPAGTRMTALV